MGQIIPFPVFRIRRDMREESCAQIKAELTAPPTRGGLPPFQQGLLHEAVEDLKAVLDEVRFSQGLGSA